MMDKWCGKVAVVTGASAGIGAAIIEDLAKNGLKVVGLARRPEMVEAIAKRLGNVSGKIIAMKCDVSNLQSIKETFKAIAEKFGSINILVNNAGMGVNGTILTSEPKDKEDEDMDKIINTNFSGLVHVTRHAYPLMLKSNDYGMIVNINSIVGHINPFPREGPVLGSVYSGTKHAVKSVSEILRQELVVMNNKKIRVSSVSPGVVETDFFTAAKFVPKDTLIGSVYPALNPVDISNAVLYLLSTPCHVNITEMTVRPVGESF